MKNPTDFGFKLTRSLRLKINELKSTASMPLMASVPVSQSAFYYLSGIKHLRSSPDKPQTTILRSSVNKPHTKKGKKQRKKNQHLCASADEPQTTMCTAPCASTTSLYNAAPLFPSVTTPSKLPLCWPPAHHRHTHTRPALSSQYTDPS